MNKNILEKAQSWGNNSYFSPEDRAEINNLIKSLPATETDLTERFHRDLEFGTGGLRAPMGMGQNRMNKYNVRRATQALCNNIIKNFGGGSAVISYDSRHNSKNFAQEAASVFAGNGIKAYIFKSMTPTPMLSFGIRHYKAQAGIMVTASHNPPIYNGYKAFWNDGGQVVPPIDQEIINSYNQLTDWNAIKYLPFAEAESKNLVQWTDENLDETFFNVIEKKVTQDKELCTNKGSQISIVFTALHGTGQIPCIAIAKKLGFSSFYSIPEQAIPDGNFSTVKSPNPEDPKALAMAVDYMLKNNADIVMGTDPDCDRLGVAINNHGKVAYLNGNQIAALMLYYIFETKQKNKSLPEKPLVIKSIVTSPIQNAIVEHFGGTVMDTLTGFKWMAGLLNNLEEKKSDYNFVFASEESFGYMPHSECRDKDGVSSVALMAEIALYYKLQGKNLIEALDLIYDQFGFYFESLLSKDYEGIAGGQKISRIMEYFRNYPETHFAGEEIIAKEDYQSSIATDFVTQKTTNIDLPKSNVLSFTFKSGNRLFLRPSGTEPKIKFYTMVREKQGTLADKKLNATKKVSTVEMKINECCENA